MRTITRTYCDPVDLIWQYAAGELGIRVVRDDEVFAAWDGTGTLRIGTAETLDPDDSLAQMIFHEFCHAIVQGPERFDLPDWGLEDTSAGRIHEKAALRLQAHWAGLHGLRQFMAATTDFRQYWDSLPENPLAVCEGAENIDPAIEFANAAWIRIRENQWFNVIDVALSKTSAIRKLIRPVAPPDSVWR